MHEMSLSRGMIDIIQDYAAKSGFRRVDVVRLEIGALSCVEPAALEFCFESVARDTVADGAKLEIINVAGEAWCWDCARGVEVDRHGDRCPGCGGFRLKVRSGDAMRIKELEVV